MLFVSFNFLNTWHYQALVIDICNVVLPCGAALADYLAS